MSDHTVHLNQGPIELKRVSVGNLVLPSGRIVAQDPFVDVYEEPFTRTVAPGTYPVYLTIAHLPDGDQRVAFATVAFRPAVPKTWEMALLPGDDPDELEEDEVFGYGVDLGAGAFVDAETLKDYQQRYADEDDPYERMQLMEKVAGTTCSYLNLEVDSTSGGNLVAFDAGWGDGAYASYFGLDQQGVCCLVTDFGVLEDEAGGPA
jgi:hypothetical protein